MNLVKSSGRNRMDDAWLNDILVTYVEEKNSVFGNNDILYRYKNMAPRREQIDFFF